RVEQRLATLHEQTGQWAGRREDAQLELESLSELAMVGEEKAELLSAQVEEQALALPDLEDALRAAQQNALQQRAAVGTIQQHIQVLGAEQRSMDEQTRHLQQRQERLATDRNSLSAPDDARLQRLQEQLAQAQEGADVADARLQELQETVPTLDEARRTAQHTVNADTTRRSGLGARLEALKALQEKVRTDGKLKPWLAKQGLEALQGLWTRLHVEPGWENALEAALRERLGALEVSRLDRVSAFLGHGAKEAPPAKLTFFTPPDAGQPPVPSKLPRLLDLLRLNDAGLRAVLADWLAPCFVADRLEDALAQRNQLGAGEVIYVPTGHCVSPHSVSFYAPDSEQAGLLARAHEIEDLDKALRAQSLICDESRSALLRAEAAYAEASQRLVAAQRESTDARGQAHTLQVELLGLQQLAEQSKARNQQLGEDLAEVEAQMDALQERRAIAEGRFEELDMQLADAQERHAQLDDRVMEAERKLNLCREQQRGLERQAQEAAFSLRTLDARRQELARTIDTATQQAASLQLELQRAQDELSRLTDAAAQAGLQNALALKLDCERALGSRRSEYDELTAKLRASDERRLTLERELEPLRQRIMEFQLKEQASRLGFEQYAQLLLDAGPTSMPWPRP
ncbi:MAG: hypothetical protein RLZZ591_2204, partial [Pseudomonadota bacterium]